MEPSSSNTGFFQEMPVVRNQFHDDVSLQRVARRIYTPHLTATAMFDTDMLTYPSLPPGPAARPD